jgi:hypothetical protein
MAAKTSSQNQIYQLAIFLANVEPIVWRRMQVLPSIPLQDLDYAIQIAMGWKNEKIHCFVADDIIYTNLDDIEKDKDEEFDLLEEFGIPLKRLLSKPERTILYNYNMGVNWVHVVMLEKILPLDPNQNYPFMAEGGRAAPPEDCEGVEAYKNIQQVYSDKTSPDRAKLLNWLGSDYDPNRFDLESVNEQLRNGRTPTAFFGSNEAYSLPSRCDRKPSRDLLGLSPAVLGAMIEYPYEWSKYIEFSAILSKEPETGLINYYFKKIIEGIGESGVKATDSGNLPRSLVNQLIDWSALDENIEPPLINSEFDVPMLTFARLIAEQSGLLRNVNGKYHISKECRQLYRRSGMREIYPLLLRTFILSFDWAELTDGALDTPALQEGFPFTLYMFSRFGKEWRDPFFYIKSFLNAFPSALDEFVPNEDETVEELFEVSFYERSLVLPGLMMGLMDVNEDESDMKIIATELLFDSVKFHVG